MKKIFVVMMCCFLMVPAMAAKKKETSSMSCEQQYLENMAKPNMTLAQVSVWSNEAVVQLFSFDHVNFRKQFQMAQEYFSPKAWESVQKQIENSGMLKRVQQDKLVVASVAIAAPVILQQGVFLERYSWKVQIPLLVMYYGDKKVTKQVVVTTLFITRSDANIGKRGISIADFLMNQSDESSVPLPSSSNNAKKKS